MAGLQLGNAGSGPRSRGLVKGPIERELKLDVDSEFQLPDVTTVAGLSLVTQPVKTLLTHYYDTAQMDLARWGTTLNYRTSSAKAGTWTVKLNCGEQGNSTNCYEIDLSGEPDLVPEPALSLTMGIRRGQALEQVAKLTTTRRAHLVLDPGGSQLVELDDDTVDYVTMTLPERRGSFREIEVELIAANLAGGSSALDSEWKHSLYSLFTDSGAKRNDGRPKLLRILFDDTPPVLQAAPKTKKASTMAELLTAIVEANLHRLLTHEAGIWVGHDPEDIHQARVATRRLRSNLKILEPLFNAGRCAAATVSGLKPLASLLGQVRDADVLGARLRAERHQVEVSDRALVDELSDLLHEERLRAHSALLVQLGSESHGQLIGDLFAILDDPPLIDPNAPAATVLLPLLAGRWASLDKAVRKLPEQPSDTELHAIRIKAKRCRYTGEMCGAVLDAKAQHLTKSVASLQEILGELQDASVTRKWLRVAALDGGSNRAMVAGQLIETQRTRAKMARHQWESAWAAASDKKVTQWLLPSL